MRRAQKNRPKSVRGCAPLPNLPSAVHYVRCAQRAKTMQLQAAARKVPRAEAQKCAAVSFPIALPLLPAERHAACKAAPSDAFSIPQNPPFQNCLNALFAKFCAGNFSPRGAKRLTNRQPTEQVPSAAAFCLICLLSSPPRAPPAHCSRAAGRGSPRAAFPRFRCLPRALPQQRARVREREREPLPPRALLP